MKVIKCSFKTQDIEKDDDLYKIFKAGGQPLKFWSLYGTVHLTNRLFKPLCLEITKFPIKNVRDLDIYYNRAGLDASPYKSPWALDNWDYFNPSTRRAIKVEFKSGSAISSIVIH